MSNKLSSYQHHEVNLTILTIKFFRKNLLLIISLVMLIFNLFFIIGLTSSELVIWGSPNRTVYAIFFYHVSGAWLAYFSFGVSLAAHVLYLRNKKVIWSRVGKNSILVGVFFTAFALITGSLWFNATSGSYGSRPQDYWQWGDGRQTMTFVLLISYIAFLIFRSVIEDKEKKEKLSAALGIALFPTVPLSYFSAIIFETLHVLINPTPGEPGNIYWDPVKIFILLFNLIAMTLFFVYVVKQLVALDEAKEKLNLIIQRRLVEE
ncbi:MAG: cytochrome c biogenesis protein CcsA [Promethearchaeota archaeon]|jgi:heme exporter protein C